MKKTITFSNLYGEKTYRLASFGSRFAARMLDTLIIIIPNSFIPFLAAWLYWALQQGGKPQATVGQRALNIRVIDQYGDEVGFGKATGRFFGNFLNLFTFFIGYLMFFFNDKNQCLHDYVSGCVVVHARPISVNTTGDDYLLDHLVE